MNKEVKETAKKDAEYDEVKEFIRQIGAEEKGIDNFFLEIIRNDDSLKIGNLDKDELGLPQLPVRTLIELSDDCKLIPSMSSFETDFKIQATNLIASSLSKDGFLIKARITQKKELLDSDKRKDKSKKGLFGKKEEET
jgi:hypothetical protein